jgi:hypothetical protein
MIQIGLDPGVKTGYCVMINGEVSTAGAVETLRGVYKLLCDTRPDEVVFEAFHRGQGLQPEHVYTIEVIGVIHLFVENASSAGGFVKLFQQSPGAKRPTQDRAKAILRGLPTAKIPEKDRPHAQDALAHLLVHND